MAEFELPSDAVAAFNASVLTVKAKLDERAALEKAPGLSEEERRESLHWLDGEIALLRPSLEAAKQALWSALYPELGDRIRASAEALFDSMRSARGLGAVLGVVANVGTFGDAEIRDASPTRRVVISGPTLHHQGGHTRLDKAPHEHPVALELQAQIAGALAITAQATERARAFKGERSQRYADCVDLSNQSVLDAAYVKHGHPGGRHFGGN